MAEAMAGAVSLQPLALTTIQKNVNIDETHDIPTAAQKQSLSSHIKRHQCPNGAHVTASITEHQMQIERLNSAKEHMSALMAPVLLC